MGHLSGMRPDVRDEWDGTKQHDVLFLLSIIPPEPEDLAQMRKEAELTKGPGAAPSPDLLYGLVRVRGCEVIEVSHPSPPSLLFFVSTILPTVCTTHHQSSLCQLGKRCRGLFMRLSHFLDLSTFARIISDLTTWLMTHEKDSGPLPFTRAPADVELSLLFFGMKDHAR